MAGEKSPQKRKEEIYRQVTEERAREAKEKAEQERLARQERREEENLAINRRTERHAFFALLISILALLNSELHFIGSIFRSLVQLLSQ